MKNTLEEYLIADMIADVPFLTLKERYNFCKAPLNVKMSIKQHYNFRKDQARFQEKIKKSTLNIYADFVKQYAANRS